MNPETNNTCTFSTLDQKLAQGSSILVGKSFFTGKIMAIETDQNHKNHILASDCDSTFECLVKAAGKDPNTIVNFDISSSLDHYIKDRGMLLLEVPKLMHNKKEFLVHAHFGIREDEKFKMDDSLIHGSGPNTDLAFWDLLYYLNEKDKKQITSIRR